MSAVARRYYERGRAALELDDLESAQEALRAALDLAPAFGNARVAYAVALAKANDCPRAAAVLRAGLGRTSSAISSAAPQPPAGGDKPDSTSGDDASARFSLLELD